MPDTPALAAGPLEYEVDPAGGSKDAVAGVERIHLDSVRLCPIDRGNLGLRTAIRSAEHALSLASIEATAAGSKSEVV